MSSLVSIYNSIRTSKFRPLSSFINSLRCLMKTLLSMLSIRVVKKKNNNNKRKFSCQKENLKIQNFDFQRFVLYMVKYR